MRFGVLLLERGTRTPLEAVPVQALVGEEVVASAETDSKGRAALVVPAAEFELVAAPSAHERLQAEVRAQAGEEREETFYLTKLRGGYGAVVRARRLRREVTKRVLPRAVVERIPGAANDTLKVIQSLPGVARAPFDGGNIVLRGSNPGDSRVFLEGLEIPAAYHFGGLRSTFRSYFLEALDFVPGNFAAEYGRATGGIIDIRVRDPETSMFRGEVDVNLYDAAFALEGPVTETFSLGGGFRRSYIDTILPAVLPEDGPISFDTAPRFYDYQLIGVWNPSSRHKVRTLYFGSLDKLELIFDSPRADPKVRGALSTLPMFHGLHLQSKLRLSPRLTQEVALRASLSTLGFSLGPEFFFDLNVRNVDTRASWKWRLSEAVTAKLGIDASTKWTRLELASPRPPKEGEEPVPVSLQETLATTVDQTIQEPAAYMELVWKPASRVTLVGGLRADYYSPIEDWTLDPRVSAEWGWSDRTTLRAGLGYYQQQPFYDETNEVTGNPSLSAERSVQASAGWAHRFEDEWTTEFTGFYKHLDRLVARPAAADFDPDRPPYESEGTGRIYGLEALVKMPLTRGFFGWIAYTFQRSFRTDPGDAERIFDFDQPHILTALGSYELGSGWTLGARFRLVSGNPDTPVNGALYDSGSGVYLPRYGAQNSDRLPTFHQLDVRLDKAWVKETWELSAYLDVQNVYNQGNPEGWRYNYDFTERSPVTGLPVLPILGVKGKW